MLQDLMGIEHNFTLRALIDNKSCWDTVHATVTNVTEKRLKKEIAAIKQMLEVGKLRELIWVPTNLMLADALTKKGVNSLKLMQVMQTGRLGAEYLNSVK